MRDTRLVVFTRPIGDPAAKSRLAAALGVSRARILHDALVRHTVRTASECNAAEIDICLACDSTDPGKITTTMKQSLPPSFTISVQSGADLGERMFNAATLALRVRKRVVIMGTDCAVMRVGHIHDAVARLSDDTPASFIPAADGGYVLIALSRCDRRLFQDISWGSPTVMGETRAVLKKLGWRWTEMPALWDIDTHHDYERLVDEGLLEPLLAT